MSPLTPEVVTTRIWRRISAARTRVIANCCSICGVPWNMALLLWTIMTSAPASTASYIVCGKATS